MALVQIEVLSKTVILVVGIHVLKPPIQELVKAGGNARQSAQKFATYKRTSQGCSGTGSRNRLQQQSHRPANIVIRNLKKTKNGLHRSFP